MADILLAMLIFSRCSDFRWKHTHKWFTWSVHILLLAAKSSSRLPGKKKKEKKKERVKNNQKSSFKYHPFEACMVDNWACHIHSTLLWITLVWSGLCYTFYDKINNKIFCIGVVWTFIMSFLVHLLHFQGHTWVHGTRGSDEGTSIRLQCWLVFIWLHAVQTTQRVRCPTFQAKNIGCCWFC